MEGSPRESNHFGRAVNGQVSSSRPEYLHPVGRPLVLCIAVAGTVDELAQIKLQVCLAGEDETLMREMKAEECSCKRGNSNRKWCSYKNKLVFVEENLQVALVSCHATYCCQHDGLP